jgi:hypothetical protein
MERFRPAPGEGVTKRDAADGVPSVSPPGCILRSSLPSYGILTLCRQELQEQGLQLLISNLVFETTALREHHQLLLNRSRKIGARELDSVEPFPGFRLKDLHEDDLYLGIGLFLPFHFLLHHLLVERLLLHLRHPFPSQLGDLVVSHVLLRLCGLR